MASTSSILFSQSSLKVGAIIAGNMVSAIAIVIVNKWIFDVFDYHFGTFVTCIHFICTYIGLRICAALGVFEIKKIPLIEVLPLCITFCGFVVFTNLSLQYNTVGFYQIMKTMTTPTILAIQIGYYNEKFSIPVMLSLIPVCIGSAITGVSNVQVNTIGTVYAIAGVLVTSMYQILVGTRQKELQVDSMQLLIYQAPISAFFLIFIIPIFDNVSISDPKSLWNQNYNYELVSTILFSGALAFFVNLTIFMLIGKTSPITYNIVGNLKLCLILLSGILLFGDPLTRVNVTSIVLTLTGIFAYSIFKVKEEQAKKLAMLTSAK